MTERVVVVGGGHNGLVAAILAAQAGRSVTLLEAADHLGGAAVSTSVFAGHQVRLSRYSYLVSLFPRELADRLGLSLVLLPRAVSSYTPVGTTGLLVERTPGPTTAESFRAVTGSEQDYRAWRRFYGDLAMVAKIIAPALTGPLRTRAEMAKAVSTQAGPQLWSELIETPIGQAIVDRFADDTVRGVVATDALIGTSTSLFDESLLANRCFLYHVIGRGTGEWLVPAGGMGAVTAALAERARAVGVSVETNAQVVGVAEDATGVDVEIEDGRGWRADQVLAAVAPATVEAWLGRPAVNPVGAQLKVNLLLDRLPRLQSGLDAAVAFAGTLHLGEGFAALESAYAQSCAGQLPDPLPAEVYCHSLTDPSILNGASGHTLTLFGLHARADLFTQPGRREKALTAALAALQRPLDEPLEDCLAVDADGRPCIELATPADLERDLLMPGGHIFHGDLDWPWLRDGEEPVGPAERYGVAVTGSSRLLLAGSGSRRGGGVSGLGGLAAADALLAISSTAVADSSRREAQ